MARYRHDRLFAGSAALLPSWQLALRSEGKAPGTVKTYSDGVTGFLRWAETSGTPPQITKPTVQAWIADLLDGGAESARRSPVLKACGSSRVAGSRG